MFFCNTKQESIQIEVIQPQHILDIQEVEKLSSFKFYFSNLIFLNLGFSDLPIWIKIINPPEDKYLFIPKFQAKVLKVFFWHNEENSWIAQNISPNQTFSHFVKDNSRPIYLEVESEKEINFSFEFSSLEDILHIRSIENFFSSIFLGWNVLIFLIVFFLSFIYKKFQYLFFGIFIFLIQIFFIQHQGLLNHLLEMNIPIMDKLKFSCLVSSFYFYFLFISKVLYERAQNKWVLWTGFFILNIFLISLLFPYRKIYYIWTLTALILNCISFILTFSSYKKNTIASVLLGTASLCWFCVVGILMLLDSSIFYFNKISYYIPNILHFLSSFLILTFFAFQARLDVQKQKEIEKNLHELDKQKLENEKKILQLEKAFLEEKTKFNFAKNEFIKQTVMSLKTPLFNIKSISEVLLDDGDVIQNGYLSKDVKSILENAKFLTNILNDLSDYSLLETNSIVLNKQPLDLKSIVEVELTSIDFLLKTKKITFESHLKDNLPLIDGDEERIYQIIHNIFFHVIQSTNSTIQISANAVPGYIKFKIKYSGGLLEIPNTDSKIYLDWSQNERVENFQKFINLLVTSKLIKLHGGKIYSKQDEEPSTIIFLPIAANQTKISSEKTVKKKNWAEYHIYPNSSTSTIHFVTEEQERILVIDDEVMNLDTLKSILIPYNYKPILVSTAKEGLEEIHKEKPDLVLVDLFMPGMDGLQFCKLVREIYDKNELPIILVTASSQWEEITELFDLINDTIIKPFTKEKLVSRIKASINLAKMNRAYKRFVPPEFINLLNKKDISELKLGDHVQKRMTVLFCDLRNYTRISESMTPEDNFSFLNSYLGRIGPIIRNHNGFIDKYIGDAIMAIFPRNAEDAVKSAIEMQKAINEFNLERIRKGDAPITAGIGIHTGDVILGTLGEEKRMEGTVISDAVNISSRLENLTKLYKATILITMETFLELEDQELYNFRILDRVKVKGKEQFITVVEIMDGYEEEKLAKLLECKVYFEEGVSHYLRKEFDESLDRFQKVIEFVPDDKATQIYIQRIQFYKKYGVPLGWDGVEVLDEKVY